MALRSDADAFWARCVELAAYWTVHPKIDDAERTTLPATCQRVKLAHFRFPSVYRFDEHGFKEKDADALHAIADRVRADADAHVVVASAVQAGIDEETFSYILGQICCQTSPEGESRPYDELWPLVGIVRRHPSALGQSPELALACVHYAMDHMESKKATYMSALVHAAAMHPATFETKAVLTSLTNPLQPVTHSFAVSLLGKLRPNVLRALGASVALSTMVRDAIGSTRRLAALERLIARVEAPANIDMAGELKAVFSQQDLAHGQVK